MLLKNNNISRSVVIINVISYENDMLSVISYENAMHLPIQLPSYKLQNFKDTCNIINVIIFIVIVIITVIIIIQIFISSTD